MCITCVDCGTEICRNGATGRLPKRCKKCRLISRAAAARSGWHQSTHKHKCTLCGVAFLSGRKSQQFCSTLCYRLSTRKRQVLICANSKCLKAFEVTQSKIGQGRKYCSRKCSPARYRSPLVCQNPACGKQFRMKHPTKNQWQNKGKYCCPECYRDHRWGSCRPRRTSAASDVRRSADRSLGTSLRKRCKVYGVTFDPACTRQAVLDRDRWKCQKCGVLCNKEYKRNLVTGSFDWNNAEHDHIIPLSIPGSPGNIFENSQCLCRRCNSTKRDKPEGQLRLCLEEEAWGKGVRVRSRLNSKLCEATQAAGRLTKQNRSLQPMA